MLPQIGKVDKATFEKLILPNLGKADNIVLLGLQHGVDAAEVMTIAIEIARHYREKAQG